MVEKASGLCWVGDPHITWRKPGRRQDEFHAATARKRAEVVRICNERNLQPVITGDLFDESRNVEVPLSTVTRTLNGAITWLRQFEHKPICLVGNHDLKATVLTDEVLMSTLILTETLIPLTGLTGGALRVSLDFAEVDLLSCLNNEPLTQDSIAAAYGVDGNAGVLRMLATHHDLNLPGAYPTPSVVTPFEVPGVPFVVNGHMHKAYADTQVGQTCWMNPGNIVRLTVDCAEHRPAVLIWDEDGWMTYPLDFEANVFDLTGRLELDGQEHVKSAVAEDVSELLAGAKKFAEELQLQRTGMLSRTDDGVYFQEALVAYMDKRDPPLSEEARALILSLVPHALGTNEVEAK